MHNLSILTRLIINRGGGGGVVAPCYVATVVIVVAVVGRLCKYSLGHDALSIILAVCRNGRGVWRVNGGV